MSQTILSPIKDLDNHGSFQRRVLEQLMPWCDKCEKAVADWMEPKNAKDWLETHWRKKHSQSTNLNTVLDATVTIVPRQNDTDATNDA